MDATTNTDAQAGATASLDAQAEAAFLDALDIDETFDLFQGCVAQSDDRGLSIRIRGGVHIALLLVVTSSRLSFDSRRGLP
jgi:hypothetical protein